jgi:hypothetical protein
VVYLRTLCYAAVGVLLVVALLSFSVSALDSTELARDNGQPADYMNLPSGIAYGVSFSPPEASWPIRRIRIYGLLFGRVLEGPGQDVTIEIWTINGTVMHSSTHSYKKFTTAPDWVDFNINAPKVSENFRVVVYAPGQPNVGGIKVGYSLNQPSYSDTIVGRRILTDWKELAFSQNTLNNRPRINWMIRVCSVPSVEIQTTTVSQTITLSQQSIPFLGPFDMSRLLQIVGVAATAGAGFLGWFLKTGKRRFVSGYLMKIDSTYNQYYMNREECRKRLSQMKEEAIQLLKKGKIDEPHFTLVDNKLTTYLKEIQ